MTFDELSLPPSLLSGIAEAGFTECTPIQSLTLPLSLAGKDVAGQAQTGTGKTAAFLITLFTRLLTRKPVKGEQPRALILAPTRELVAQIEQDAQSLGGHCGLTIQAIYGGIDYMKQRNALREGADIVIGTPGRLIDYLKQKVYSLNRVEMLVIDEADRMFDMGFIADLRYILRRLPPFDKRQNMMFSATLNQRVMELAYEFMNLPEKVSVSQDQMTAVGVKQLLYHCSRKEKFPLLLGLLQREGAERTMLFVNTKREAEYLRDRLNANNCPCQVISGDVEQRKRMKILNDFKQGKLALLIGTDVASRGLHIDGVSHVINYDLPQDCEDYVHRIGRTARAGAEGKALSLADEDGAFYLEAIEEYIQHKIPVDWPDDDLFVHDYQRPPRPPVRSPKPKGKEGTKFAPGEKRSAAFSHNKPRPARLESNIPSVPSTESPAASSPAAKRRRRKKPAAQVSSPEQAQ